jgi:hypothetical protein
MYLSCWSDRFALLFALIARLFSDLLSSPPWYRCRDRKRAGRHRCHAGGARLNDVCFTCEAPPILCDHLLVLLAAISGPAIPRYDSTTHALRNLSGSPRTARCSHDVDKRHGHKRSDTLVPLCLRRVSSGSNGSFRFTRWRLVTPQEVNGITTAPSRCAFRAAIPAQWRPHSAFSSIPHIPPWRYRSLCQTSRPLLMFLMDGLQCTVPRKPRREPSQSEHGDTSRVFGSACNLHVWLSSPSGTAPAALANGLAGRIGRVAIWP